MPPREASQINSFETIIDRPSAEAKMDLGAENLETTATVEAWKKDPAKLKELLAASLQRVDESRDAVVRADAAIASAEEGTDAQYEAIREAVIKRNELYDALTQGLLQPRLISPQLTVDQKTEYEKLARDTQQEVFKLEQRMNVVSPTQEADNAIREAKVRLEELRQKSVEETDKKLDELQGDIQKMIEKSFAKPESVAVSKTEDSAGAETPVAPSPVVEKKSWATRVFGGMRQNIAAISATVKDLWRRRRAEANEHLPPAPEPVVRRLNEEVIDAGAITQEIPRETVNELRKEAEAKEVPAKKFEMSANERAAVDFNENFLAYMKSFDASKDFFAFENGIKTLLDAEKFGDRNNREDIARVMNKIMYQALKDEDINVATRRLLVALLSKRKFISAEATANGQFKIKRLDAAV